MHRMAASKSLVASFRRAVMVSSSSDSLGSSLASSGGI